MITEIIFVLMWGAFLAVVGFLLLGWVNWGNSVDQKFESLSRWMEKQEEINVEIARQLDTKEDKK